MTANSYATAGVDVTRGYRALDLMRSHIARTATPGVVGGVGGFSGLFDIGGGRLLSAGADGVGTKLKLATLAGRHDTVGIDCVAMCVNDVACSGAEPLFFLDYFASARTDPELVADVVKGVADGCVQAGCALLGGETAEMPGIYAEGDYDLAGFAVGIVDADRVWDGPKRTTAGDELVGLASSGPHSNGFSLIRRLFPPDRLLGDRALLDALLAPTRIYVKPLLALAGLGVDVHGAAHITGGGFFENLPRMLAPGLSARIDRAALPPAPIFDDIASAGRIARRDMFATFNMGVGLVVAVPPGDADRAIAALHAAGAPASVIGQVVAGDHEVLL